MDDSEKSSKTGHAGQFDPYNLVSVDTIIVIVQFRLGIMGFFNYWSASGPVGGNYGLLDQKAAIKFIKINAEYIGGDKNKTMIMGEGSGGASVGYQLLNEESAGMIQAAWMQSGTPVFGKSEIQETAEINSAVIALCKEVGACDPNQVHQGDTTAKMVQQLKENFHI